MNSLVPHVRDIQLVAVRRNIARIIEICTAAAAARADTERVHEVASRCAHHLHALEAAIGDEQPSATR